MNKIDISSEIERFELHIENNSRVIFSSRFGEGKTYFLQEYIQQKKDSTFFITLHPVNYSVARNEDIFEYIKRDILIQLTKHPAFKEINWKQVIQEIFNYDNILETGEFLSDSLPLSKAILTPFRLFKKIDDKYAIDKFFDAFADQKGSIFEKDEFTQAITYTINQIKSEGTKCVLIIEDLDRIDPQHIFRILNVLGAHIDTNDCIEENKFGFSNIVLVLDYPTTRNIFYHFYGKDADFEGYITKFLSHNPFYYSITKTARQQLKEYISRECKIRIEDLEFLLDPTSKVTLLSAIEKMTVRDIVQIMDGLENQLIKHDIQYKAGKGTSLEPISKLLAIIVRMKVNYNLIAIADYLSRTLDGMRVLGTFILEEPSIFNKFFTIQREPMCVQISEDANGYVKVDYQVIWGNTNEIKAQDLALKAIFGAKKYVLDCI